MAKTLSTYREADSFQTGLVRYLRSMFNGVRMSKWDSVSGSYDIVNTKSNCQTTIDAWDTIYTAQDKSVWSFTKNAGNPLIAKVYNTSYYEFYPPTPILDDDDTNYRIIGKNSNEVWGYTSTDGITWSETGKLIAKGAASSWDAGQCTSAYFYKENGVYKILYNGYGDDGVLDYGQGIATANSWGTSWTKGVSNPINTVAPYNAANGTSFVGVVLSSVVKVGSTWYFFGIVHNQSFTDVALAYGTSSSFETPSITTKICTLSDLGTSYAWLQSPDVFKHPTTGEYILTFTVGNRLNNATTDTQSIYAIYSGSTIAPVFTQAGLRIYPIMVCDTAQAYENSQNYAAHWLRDIEGNLLTISGDYCFYYAGHQNTATPSYTGVTCLATITTIP